MAEPDFKLPRLLTSLQLKTAPASSTSGEPAWTVFNPIANQHYRLNWAEFECLARYAQCQTAMELLERVNCETTLRIELDDIKKILIFLQSNGLIEHASQKLHQPPEEKSFWSKLLHGYLYFSVPLGKPQKFLEATLPLVRPLLSQAFSKLMIGLFIIGLILTIGRIDEFLHTFNGLFSLSGLIMTLCVLTFVKIMHEFGHAYTAVNHGVKVPHMGVAFMVMYPVLYTETSGAWQLASRRDRFAIGFAGIRTELCLATIFLLLWHVMPVGSTLQTIAFLVITVALAGSLLINLNPLMRFDGYYMLADLTGLDNLQYRAIAMARWQLRQKLFGFQDQAPEFLDARTQKFLLGFGWALLIYRFFLFTGIALLVYHVFFKPLGLLLMLVELGYFIILPILGELKIWWQRRRDILRSRRSYLGFALFVAGMVWLALPIHKSITLPAVMHAETHKAIHAVAPSRITKILVQDNDWVEAGDVLLITEAPKLDHEIELAQQQLELTKVKLRQQQTISKAVSGQDYINDEQIKLAEQKLHDLEEQKLRLVITAPLSGQVRDMTPYLSEGMYIPDKSYLMSLVADKKFTVTSYAGEAEIGRIKIGESARFIPEATPFKPIEARISEISSTNIKNMPWTMLASQFGGLLKTEAAADPTGQLIPVEGVYEVKLDLNKSIGESPQSLMMRGHIEVQGEAFSPLMNFINALTGLLQREIGLN